MKTSLALFLALAIPAPLLPTERRAPARIRPLQRKTDSGWSGNFLSGRWLGTLTNVAISKGVNETSDAFTLQMSKRSSLTQKRGSDHRRVACDPFSGRKLSASFFWLERIIN